MAARNQLFGLLQTAKQLEAEAEQITKHGLWNLWRFWPEVPDLFPETNGHILKMSTGDVWAGKSPSCGQTDYPGYGVLHVMPPHLANTHDCCCQTALDKENVLTCCSGSWGKLGVGLKGQMPAEHRQVWAFLRSQEVGTVAQAAQSGSWQDRKKPMSSSCFFCDTRFFFPRVYQKGNCINGK